MERSRYLAAVCIVVAGVAGAFAMLAVPPLFSEPTASNAMRLVALIFITLVFAEKARRLLRGDGSVN